MQWMHWATPKLTIIYKYVVNITTKPFHIESSDYCVVIQAITKNRSSDISSRQYLHLTLLGSNTIIRFIRRVAHLDNSLTIFPLLQCW
ncbi:hypothetical protein GDO78_012681 [Eleutherodactylus coqui]|uniref:Uncharacterized protein n=1 Tax=Eleutherodactylus coqui TaxID=57060 RepID=A0A8J6EZN8_ELECQ|nr:hypothetical protein GDO78_012681 [Eleutherodactylus coqui]